MVHYELTKEQLDHVQEQIQVLSKVTDAQQNLLKALEYTSTLTVDKETAYKFTENELLKKENFELKDSVEKLQSELNIVKSNAAKAESLLGKERKKSEYLLLYVDEMEEKRVEETLIKKLTDELCKLQKDEIKINKSRILELRNMIKSIDESGYVRIKNLTGSEKHQMGNSVKEKKLNFIIAQLKTQLLDFLSDLENNPALYVGERKCLKELEKWLREIEFITAELNEIENLRKNLQRMKKEIESKRKSI